ncbi:MAG: S16 family serine protease, partial [bacterium]
IDKENIAIRHLVEKQREENGLAKDNMKIRRDAIVEIIQRYTREAGVRNLEREIGKVCRKVATQLVVTPKRKKFSITPKKVHEFLGVPRYKHDFVEGPNEVGVSTGMAWTQNGGELLFTEVSLMRGTGRLMITGRLGDVMKESVQAALSYVRGNANRLGIYSDVFKKTDIHIHVPEGATPKDGPSAGVTIVASLVSALTQIPSHKRVAMTGEVTLRGKALAIGGLKEKLLAAKRGGVERVLIPHANENDLIEIPAEIKKGLEITPLKTVTDMLEIALERMPEPVVDPAGSGDPGSELGEEIIQPPANDLGGEITPTVYM